MTRANFTRCTIPSNTPARWSSIAPRASGCYTTDDRTVLDGMAGLWNVNIGYGNQELPDVAAAQMRKVAFTSNFVGMTTPPAAELAYRMAGMAHPTLNTTFFTSGGSESNDIGLQDGALLLVSAGQEGQVQDHLAPGAYHGITVAATAATGIPRYHTMFGPLSPGFSHIPAPNPYRYDGDIRPGETVGQAAARALEEAILREGPETVAAFIAEPIQGVGGVIVPPDDYFPLVRAICDKYDVLLIADEVICGFGRTGLWFGQQQWDLRPDIMAFAKGVTSGYLQLGGIQISDAIREVIDTAPPEDTWMHGYTYSGHAAACAVGLKNLEIIERDESGRKQPAHGRTAARRGWSKLLDFSIVGDVRGRGLLCGVEIVKDKATREAGSGQGTGDLQRLHGARAAHAQCRQYAGLCAAAGHQRRRGRSDRRHSGQRHRRNQRIDGPMEPMQENPSVPWHTRAVGTVLDELHTTADGLSSTAAQERLTQFGPNELKATRGISPWEILLEQFKNVLIIILLVATALSVFLGHGIEAVAIAVIVLFAVLLGFVQEYRAERAIEALRRDGGPDGQGPARRHGVARSRHACWCRATSSCSMPATACRRMPASPRRSISKPRRRR